MLRFIALFWIAGITFGFDCESDRIKLGDACLEHVDCNYGDCAIIHSKCSPDWFCECTIGYYGSNGSTICSKYELGAWCNTTEQCEETRPRSMCGGGQCTCIPGYYQETSRTGIQFCSKIVGGTPCEKESDGDAFCRQADSRMVCKGNCKCPRGEIYIHEIGKCANKSKTCDEVCSKGGGLCYLNEEGNDTCECPPRTPGPSWNVNPSIRYSSVGDPLLTGCDVIEATVGHLCEYGSVTCADRNAQCVHYHRLTKRYTCRCKTGYVTVPDRDNPVVQICYRALAPIRDQNCRQCVENDGMCYDIDDDGVHDACACPNSRSTSSFDHYQNYCDTQHVNVTCDANMMRICYDPHDTYEFPDMITSLIDRRTQLYIQGYNDDTNCWFEQIGVEWCLDLSFNHSNFNCGTKQFKNKMQLSYTNTFVLQRDLDEHTIDDMYMYVYCTYDLVVKVSTFSMAEPSGPGGAGPSLADEGEEVKPVISLELTDDDGDPITTSILGQPVKLIGKLDDDKGVYRCVETSILLASDLPDLESPLTNTELLLMDGCPVEGSLADDLTIDATCDNETSESEVAFSMFMMRQTGGSEYIFFHAALKACFQGKEEECAVRNCTRRRKRSPDRRHDAGTMTDKALTYALRKLRRHDYEVKTCATRVQRRPASRLADIADTVDEKWTENHLSDLSRAEGSVEEAGEDNLFLCFLILLAVFIAISFFLICVLLFVERRYYKTVFATI